MLTPNQIDVLEYLVGACGWPLKDWVIRDGWWAKPMHCGGFNGSFHGPCLSRLADRGLCDRKRYIVFNRAVNAYRPNAKTIDALQAEGRS